MSTFDTSEQVNQLDAPLDASRVRERKAFDGSNVTLSYLEGHDIIRMANKIFGFGNWKRKTIYNKQKTQVEDYRNKEGKLGYYVSYEALVTIYVKWDGEWVDTDGTGYGESVTYGQAIGAAHESASKEAETDAMKRAFVCWGDQFGLALYDKFQAHVTDDPVAPRSKPQAQQRKPQQQVDDGDGPACPKCGGPMGLRTAKTGKNAGNQFWGCKGYPDCKGIVNLDDVQEQPPAADDEDEINAAFNMAADGEDPFADQ